MPFAKCLRQPVMSLMEKQCLGVMFRSKESMKNHLLRKSTSVAETVPDDVLYLYLSLPSQRMFESDFIDAFLQHFQARAATVAVMHALI